MIESIVWGALGGLIAWATAVRVEELLADRRRRRFIAQIQRMLGENLPPSIQETQAEELDRARHRAAVDDVIREAHRNFNRGETP